MERELSVDFLQFILAEKIFISYLKLITEFKCLIFFFLQIRLHFQNKDTVILATIKLSAQQSIFGDFVALSKNFSIATTTGSPLNSFLSTYNEAPIDVEILSKLLVLKEF